MEVHGAQSSRTNWIQRIHDEDDSMTQRSSSRMMLNVVDWKQSVENCILYSVTNNLIQKLELNEHIHR